MQLQLTVDDLKANIFLELLEVFKKDSLVKEYTILDTYNAYEKEVLGDLQNLHLALKEEGDHTDKFIEIKTTDETSNR